MSNRRRAVSLLHNRPNPPLRLALGLIGTLILCAAAMMAHLTPDPLKPVAAVLWIIGFATQALAFILALHARWLNR